MIEKKVLFVIILSCFLISFSCMNKKTIRCYEKQITGLEKPIWISDTPTSENKKYLIGISSNSGSENSGFDSALKKVQEQLVDYFRKSDTVNYNGTEIEKRNLSYKLNYSTNVEDYHVERWKRLNENNDIITYYKVYVLVSLIDNTDNTNETLQKDNLQIKLLKLTESKKDSLFK